MGDSQGCREDHGAGTTITPPSSDVTAVTRPATGRYVLTLAASRFTTDIRLVNQRPHGWA